MARIPRLVLTSGNACYHIITRGNQKQTIFTDEEDRKKYLNILAHYKKRYYFWIYSYCLMPNHVHLILEPNEKWASISQIMQGINLTYCQWFNVRHGKVGHLWQGRFKSFIISKDAYLLSCINYIEFNPVRAGITSDPVDYLWSSCKYRLLGAENRLLSIPELETKLT